MYIKSSSVQLAGRHALTTRHEVRESLDMRTPRTAAPGPPPAGNDRLTLSAPAAQQSRRTEAAAACSNDVADPNLAFLRDLMEFVTGRRIRLLRLEDMQGNAPVPDLRDPSGADTASSGFSLEYDYHETRSESELTQFSASGDVVTADGRTIHFDLQVSMQRSYSEEVNISVRMGDAAREKKDPLVINLDGHVAQLAGGRFRFDIDADGAADNIPLLAAGSGYLALDRNGDGRINDGSELFGARSGDGFAELAARDSDGNRWIDQADPVFAQLRIWTQGEGGKLQSLADGEIRTSGVYLAEDGSSGSIQQIDLMV
jgi:hypothetical protein